jgi:branched-subunit amino acid aminotransferase/4-amino-4-deoxychorismate lyase
MILGFLVTSASVERAFSVACSVTGDYQMAMREETVPTRVMIQAHWRTAQPLLADVLAMGRARSSRAHRELEEQKHMEDEPWRLGITEEMGIAHMPSDGET